MSRVRRRPLIMMLIGIDEHGKPGDHINGITRLQKFLYLLEEEDQIRPVGGGFEFEPYDAGPFSSRLYDDLEVLENLGLIAAEVTAEATEEEEPDLDKLSYGDLMESQNDKAADVFEERRFYLTEDGLGRIKQFLDSPEYRPVVDGISKVKSRFSHYSLRDLLYYVYTNYPDMTTESKIKEEVLRRHRN